MIPRFFLLLFLSCIGATVFPQNLDSLLLIQRSRDPQEKVYVHFDKNYYNPGETIWYKAYLFAGSEPSEISKNFYAELVDEQGAVLSQKTAPISFAGASGSFDLDSALNKPIIYFRAYTMSMLNGDTSFIYTKAFRILLPTLSAAKKSKQVNATQLKFLPEGGDLVNGLVARVAFRATNGQDLPETIAGNITDNTGAKVAELKTLHDGMGLLSFVPESGKAYSATWKDQSGKQYTTALPATKANGISLRITEEAGNKRFTIYRTNEAPTEIKRLYLIGYMNQEMAFKATVNLESKLSATGMLPTQDLPSGILQITVFDSNYKPLAERISFVNNRNYEFDGDAYFTQKNFSKRGLNQVEVIMSDTLPANLSISVTDADLHQLNSMDDNIISRLLLTGELRGKIVNPYYYFFSNNDSASIHLDLVMLTHGWRKYNWDDVLAGKTPPSRWKESNYLSLSGKIAGLQPGSFSPDLQLTGILQTADSAKNIISLPVDKNGKVFTEGLVFYDNAKLFFNFNKKSLSFDKSMLIVDNGLRKGYSKIAPDTTVKAGMTELSTATYANNLKINTRALQAGRLLKSNVLENVTVTSKAKTAKDKMEEKYVSGLFAGDARSFDLINDPFAAGAMNIFQYLQGKVAGLQITSGAGTPSLSWRGGTPALYLNEMQTDANLLASTPVSDIAYVKVFRPGESVASGGGNGVIAIYTRKGGDAPPDPATRGLSYVQMTGYSAVKQFYSPDYATVSESHSADDVRRTLYWNPSIILDRNRKRLRIKFYNNDITNRFRLVMEGLNAYGKLIHIEKEITN